MNFGDWNVNAWKTAFDDPLWEYVFNDFDWSVFHREIVPGKLICWIYVLTFFSLRPCSYENLLLTVTISES